MIRPQPKIAALEPYVLADFSAPAGMHPISLAQNESIRGPCPAALEAASRTLAGSALYPDPDWTELRAAIATVQGVEPASILCGAGSMELIGALAHAYLGPDDRALTTAHGYLYFRTAARLAGAGIDLAPERELTVDIDALLAAVGPATRVVFVADPGNPSGTALAPGALVRLRDGLPDDVLLVIDQAYGEFRHASEHAFALVDRGDTVVLRTFSKAYGLAGMRVGWGLFPPAMATQVRKVLNPNNVTGPAQAAAAAAMQDQPYMRETVALTAARRDRFSAHARALGLEVPESRTNFVLLRFRSAETARAADAALRARGVVMRGMGGYGLPECLRATIGSDGDMARAAEALAQTLQSENAS